MTAKRKNYQAGLSLIELVIAIGIFGLSFAGLFGVLTSSMAVIAKNKARLGAMALVEEQIEYVRSLPFASVGTVTGNPSGTIPQNETITLNGLSYNRRNAIFWVDDPGDGTALLGTDTISTDYKRVKVEVSWNFRGITSTYSSTSNVTPKGLETNVPGGIFNIRVFDYQGNNFQGAKILIDKSPNIFHAERYSNAQGQWLEYGVPPGTNYEISVSKAGYSTSTTYGVTVALPTPDPGHLTSIDDFVNPISFQIDKLSNREIFAYDAPSSTTFTDSFSDFSLLSSYSSTTVLAGSLVLTDDGFGNYDALGTARSVNIAPSNIYQWTSFSWNDTTPTETSLVYRVYSVSGGVTTIIPDSVLPGNSSGFSNSPVDLTPLNTLSSGGTAYDILRVGVTASTTESSKTPSIQNWTVSYKRHIPKGNFTFHMRGAKTIGLDSLDSPVYKYDKDLITDSSGYLIIDPLEWDTYTLSAAGYDVSNICAPQPFLVVPDTTNTTFVDFVVDTAHTLLARVIDSAGVEQKDALIRLYRSGYSTEKKVEKRCAQAFWSGLSEGKDVDGNAYSLDFSVPPYTSTSTVAIVEVSGDSNITLTLP